MQAGVRQARLLDEPGAGEDGEARGLPVRVVDQRAAAGSRLAVEHQGATGGGRLVEEPTHGAAFLVPTVDQGYLHS